MYVNYWHGAVVNPATGVIDAKPSFGIALDPATKSLYVDHRTSVSVYKAPVEPGEAPALTIGTGSLINGYGVAVSEFPATKGQVAVADAGNGKVKVYDPKVSLTVPVREIGGAGTAAGRFVSLVDSSLAIDQSNGNLLVADNTQPGFEHPIAAISEFNAEGLYRGQLEKTIIDGAPVGIAFDESPTPTNGQLYVTSGNGSNIVIPPELGPPASEQGALYLFGPSGPGQKLKATISGAGQGSVKSTPAGINCPAACEAELNSGAVVTLTATPEPGSVFAGWSGACTGTDACQVILNAVATVDAKFDVAPAALSGGSGLRSGAASTDASASFGPRPERRAQARPPGRSGCRHRRPRGDAPGRRRSDRDRQGPEARLRRPRRTRPRQAAPAPQPARPQRARQEQTRPPLDAGRSRLHTERWKPRAVSSVRP